MKEKTKVSKPPYEKGSWQKKLKDALNSMLNLPVGFYVGFVSVIGVLVLYQVNTGFNPWVSATGALVIIVGALSAALGSGVWKSILSVFSTIYIAALTTSLIMLTHQKIVEPMMLTMSAYALFIAISNGKKYTIGIRSRWLWAFIYALGYSVFKVVLALYIESYLLVEALSVMVGVVLLVLFNLWIDTSKSTKIVEPQFVDERELDNYRILYVEPIAMKAVMTNKGVEYSYNWANSGKNAYPWLYNELFRALDDDLNLIVSYLGDKSEPLPISEKNWNTSNSIEIIGNRDRTTLDKIIDNYIKGL